MDSKLFSHLQHSDSVKKEDFPGEDGELCRLCAKKSTDCYSILIENFHETLNQIFGLSINPTDNLPKAICTLCFSTAKLCLKFLIASRKAEESLREIFDPQTVEVLVKPDLEIIKANQLPPDPLMEENMENDSWQDDKQYIREVKPVILASRRSLRIQDKRDKRFQAAQEDLKEPEIEMYNTSAESSESSEPEGNDLPSCSFRRKKSLRSHKRKKAPTLDEEEYTEKEIEMIENFYNLECHTCYEKFVPFLYLQRHCIVAHKKNVCLVCCGCKMKNRVGILDHMTYHNNPNAFKCIECGKVFMNSQKLSSHKVLKHTPKDQLRYQCHECPKIFMEESQYMSHLMEHLNNEGTKQKTWYCYHCNKPYGSESIMKAHIRNIHEDAIPRYVCYICGVTVKGMGQLNIHVENHEKKGPGEFTCAICEKRFRQKSHLRHHVKNHNLEGLIYECDKCGKISSNETALKKHIRVVHLLKRRFKCTICVKAFKYQTSLNEHMTTHTKGGMLYTCLFCDKMFNSSSNRYAHQKKKHPAEYKVMNEKRILKQKGLLDEQSTNTQG